MQNNQNPTNYFFRLIKGEIPLVITFWFWFIFVGFTIKAFTYIYYISSYSIENPYRFEISLAITLLTFFYFLLIIFAIYKSAMKYEGSKIIQFLSKFVAIFCLFFISQTVFERFMPYIQDDKAILKSEIENLSKKVPYKINNTITLLKADIQDDTIYYTYRLEDFLQEKLHGINTQLFKDDIIQSNCENQNIASLLDKDFIFNFEYVNKYDKKFSNLSIDKKTCQNLNRDIEILKKILAQEQLSSFSF